MYASMELEGGATSAGRAARWARGRILGAAQLVLLLVFGIMVLTVMAYDARLYQGVDLDGKPLYPEINCVHPCQDVGSNAAPGSSGMSGKASDHELEISGIHCHAELPLRRKRHKISGIFLCPPLHRTLSHAVTKQIRMALTTELHQRSKHIIIA